MKFFKALLAAAMLMLILSFSSVARIPFIEIPRIEELLDLVGNGIEAREMNWLAPGARIVFDASIYPIANPKNEVNYWLVCDIFAVTEGGLVGMSLSNVILDGGKGILREDVGISVQRKQAGTFWFNPDILAAVAKMPEGPQVSSGKKLISGTWQPAHTMQAIGASGFMNETSYSAETGILLSDVFVVEDDTGNASLHSSMAYKGYRQVFSGLEDYSETVVRKGTKLFYDVRTEMGGIPLDLSEISYVLTAEELGPDWILYTMDVYEDGDLKRSDAIADSYRFIDDSCSHLPSEWLKGLKPGAVIWDDDLIGSTVIVEGVIDTPEGKRLIMKGIEGLTEAIIEYDLESGFLVKVKQTITLLGIDIIEELTEVQHEGR